MAKYAILFRFSAEALRRFVENPADRGAVIADLAASAGGGLESTYWMFGQYDGLTILDLPDSKIAAALSLAVASSGSFSSFETHELIEPSEYVPIAERAQQLSFLPPGG